jgi:DNA-directed RNA polymerase specialized sigma24 family protein
LTTQEQSSELIEFAITAAGKLARRAQHRPELAGLDVEDIEQELLLYVLERAERFDPLKANHEAFVNHMLKTGIGKMLREAGRKRSRPPEGMQIESFAVIKEQSDGRPEELLQSLNSEDSDRRRLTRSRNPLEDFELSDAVQHQIATLPEAYRPIALQLMKSNRTESAQTLGISKRKFAEAMKVVTEHFAGATWLQK